MEQYALLIYDLRQPGCGCGIVTTLSSPLVLGRGVAGAVANHRTTTPRRTSPYLAAEVELQEQISCSHRR
jgi:hypothetical protein